MSGYNLIYADPPWKHDDAANAGRRGAMHHYPVMEAEAIAAMPVQDVAAPDCLLAMWWVAQMPEEALLVARAWGFRPVTMTGFVWAKQTRRARVAHFGMGHWTRQGAECCLFAVRGRPARVDAGVRSLIVGPVREHSRKPDAARRALVRLLGDVPRVELFARELVPGWHAWGNQVGRFLHVAN